MGENDFESTRAAPGGLNDPAAQLFCGAIVGGHYKLLEEVGRGGMGVVYRAYNQAFGREYALKALAPDQINAANWQRFQSEGRAIARLEHRNIVKIYDMGVIDGRLPFYVMDYLEGPSLADLIQSRGPLDAAFVINVFQQICTGLGYAHQAGLIHRDIKPSNIILTGALDRPLVKIVDFGLVKMINNGASAAANSVQQSLTATGEIFGSPLYMSPEQCLGEKTDERSDIYALGCTLFEALVGTPPFKGENAMATVMMHQSKMPPGFEKHRPEVKNDPLYASLEAVVSTMLAKNPDDRQQSMAVIARELARIGEGKTVRPEAAFKDSPLFEIDEIVEDKKARALPMTLMAGVFGLLLVIAGGAWWYAVATTRPAVVAENKKIWLSAADPRQEEAKNIFNHIGPITDKDQTGGGHRTRTFTFPDIPLGLLSWENMYRDPVLAANTVEVPTGRKVTLTMDQDLGRYTLAFPAVLAGFGPADINCLMFETKTGISSGSYGEGVSFPEVSLDLVENISSWTALETFSAHNFKIGEEALAGFKDMHPVQRLFLPRSAYSAKILAQIPWLRKIRWLDLKACDDIDVVLKALRGSLVLRELDIDDTTPSASALSALADCPALAVLSLNSCGIDDEQLASICRIKSLTHLNICRATFKHESLAKILALKNIKQLLLKHTSATEADKAMFKRAYPDAEIKVD